MILHSHRRVSIMLVVVVLFALGGCVGGASQPASYYVLGSSTNLSTDSGPLENVAVGVGPIKIPGHLERPHIVTRPGRHRVAVNEFHRWGTSLKEQVSGALVENLSTLLGTPLVSAYPWERPFKPDFQVYVDIRRFEGQLGDSVALEGIWWIVKTSTEKRLLVRRFSQTAPVVKEDFEAYVAAQNSALGKLSMEIAEGILSLAKRIS